MKVKSLPQLLVGGFFAALFSVCGVGCLLTGFNLPVSSSAGMYLFCVLFSILPLVALRFRNGIWVFVALSAFGAFHLLRGGELWEQLQSFAYIVTGYLEETYGFDTVGEELTVEFDLVVILFAYLTAVSFALCVGLGKTTIYILPVAALAPVLCLMTMEEETFPKEIFLYFFLLGCVMILLMDWTKEHNRDQLFRLFRQTILPIATVLGLIFVSFPKAEYVNRAEDILDRLTEWVEEKEWTNEGIGEGSLPVDLTKNTVNLRYVGPKSLRMTPVMTVDSPYYGVIYLRGRDYDVYTGTVWESTKGRSELITEGTGSVESLSVSTVDVMDILYTPYYSADTILLTDGCYPNSEGLKDYTHTVSLTPKKHNLSYRNRSAYTALPPQTLGWAVPLVLSVVAGDSVTDYEMAEDIKTFVRNSAKYNLSTSFMNDSHSDFAQWFLEESDVGYCVHFATAAAVLLRAAGIPARYVEGYMVKCDNTDPTTVREKDAHAWTEYYDSEASAWRILDATPSQDQTGEETEPLETTAPETEGEETNRSPFETLRPDRPAADPLETEGETEKDGDADPNDRGKTTFRIPRGLRIAGGILLCFAIIPIQGEIRIALNKKRWNGGKPNERALARWSISRAYAKRMKTALPRELEELALKARYSQYTLTEEELARFDLFRNLLLKSVCSLSVIRRFLLRWIFSVG